MTSFDVNIFLSVWTLCYNLVHFVDSPDLKFFYPVFLAPPAVGEYGKRHFR